MESAAPRYSAFGTNGIKMARRHNIDYGVDVEQLKFSTDPLFGLTHCGMGLFYETAGPIVAVFNSPCRLADTAFNTLSLEGRQAIVDEFAIRLRKLSTRVVGPDESSGDLFVGFLEHIAARAKSPTALCDLLSIRLDGPEYSNPVQAWMRDHPNFAFIRTPLASKWWAKAGKRIIRDPEKGQLPVRQASRERWVDFVQRYLMLIAKWPLQTTLLDDMFRISQKLRELRSADYTRPIIIY